MFKNFKAIAHMRSPVATIDPIILDSIVSAAKAKEILEEEFYSGKNKYGTKEQIENMLEPILDKQSDVYCTSIGIGDNREYVGSWTKRWDNKNDDVVNLKSKKKRIDIGSGRHKNFHMPLVLKSYKTITFYVRGDMTEIKRLLENYIFYLGKKGSQGYGQIRKWEFKEVEENNSLWKNNKPMRPIPAENCKEYVEAQIKAEKHINARLHALIPPYWRKDYRVFCIMPET